jgi:PAS domain S-box-containing protein
MSTVESDDCGAADYLFSRRGALTRHWLRAIRKEMRIRAESREAVAGLIDQLPLLFDELCAQLRSGVSSGEPARRATSDSRMHALERWRQGFTLDELYLELDLLQRCVHASIRTYYDGAASRKLQARTHEIVEEFFSDAIRNAIRRYEAQADRRVSDALRDRDSALAAQQRSDERLRLATEAAGLGIFEWDPQTDAAVWENDRMFEITGQLQEHGPLSAREFCAMLVSPEDSARVLEGLGQAALEPLDLHFIVEIRKMRTGAPAVVEISARVLPDATGLRSVLVGTMADVTSRVKAEEALKEADRRKDVFLATLAHELRNPLAPILNAAQLLQRNGLSATQQQWAQGLIERHATHLAHLIDDLLDLSRIATGKVHLSKEVFDIMSAIDRAVEINVPAAAERGQRLDVAGVDKDTPLPVRGDPTRITQVFTNLLDNAIKYTESGGNIRLSVEARERQVVIAVEDNGIGIEPEFIPLMFETFEQGADAGSGSGSGSKRGLGIGLSVARSLITMHAGTIHAASEGRGKGSRFVVTLPLCDASSSAVQQAGRAAPVTVSRRVLIVDDNHDAAMSLAALLEGHDVRTAGSGQEAIAVVRQFRPHVVFLDLGLPDIDGCEVARQLSADLSMNGADTRPTLVALTGHGQPEDRERTRSAGFDHHIVKPAVVEDLVRLVRDAGD